jgi:pimeloyl-ACP methyl ester carboxylesterase
VSSASNHDHHDDAHDSHGGHDDHDAHGHGAPAAEVITYRPDVRLPPLRDKLVNVNGVNLRVRYAGVDGAPVALFLHGFPESWYGWRAVLRAVFDAGYQVVLPDLRGYGKSDKPVGLAAFTADVVVQDAVAVLDAFKAKKASVIGHDLGGQVAWRLAAAHPDRVEKLVVVGAPHPSLIRSNKALLPRGAWTGAIAIPPLLPWLLPKLNYAPIAWSWLDAMNPGSMSPADLEKLRDSWAREFGLAAMLSWYRASWPSQIGDVRAPTLVVTGSKDRSVPAALAEASAAKVSGAKTLVVDNAGHWVHHDQPEALTAALVEFLGAREFQKSWRPRQW